MKKLLLLLLVITLTVSLVTSCSVLEGIFGPFTEDSDGYLYTDFTPKEKEIFNKYIGLVIPFAPNDEYYVEGYNTESDFENGINFYALVDSEDDFEAYRALYSDYELVRTEHDEDNTPTYFYVKDHVEVSLTYFTALGIPWIDVYVSKIVDEGDDPDSGDDIPDGGHLYTDFTDEEKALLTEHFGFVIPFIANSEYNLKEMEDEDGSYLNFYTFGNTEAEFDEYLKLFDVYTFDSSDTDEDGDTWYYYEGKPLIIAIEDECSDEEREFFTIKASRRAR